MTIKTRLLSSNAIEMAGYDSDTFTLFLKFRNNPIIYKWSTVPEHIYNKLINSSSPGKFYNSYIRGKYHTKR